MSLLRVLLVSSKYPPEYAGSGLRAHNTYKRLSQKYSVRFDVIASSITSNKSRRYEWDGVTVNLIANKSNKRVDLSESDRGIKHLVKRIINKLYSLRDYWLEALPTFFYMARNRAQYDVIHVFGNVNVTSAAISYAKIAGKPIMVELVNLADNPHQYEPKPISLLFGGGFPKQALLVCISEYLKQVCLNHGYTDEQIWCRPNPVDESRFSYETDRRSKYRQVWPDLSKSDVLLLHLAKFIPRKHQLFMVQVMPHLPENYKLILAGPLVDSGPLLQRDREYYRSVLDAIRANDLQRRVQVMPQFIEKPEIWIKAADVFVMPTTREALGTPVLEALACGVPVVANDIPGVFDQWVEDGVNGYICSLDHVEWAERIMLAAQINEGTMRQASRDILDAASTEVIDREYYQRLIAVGRRNAQQDRLKPTRS